MYATMYPSPAEVQTLMNVALGKEKADLAVMGGDLVNVYTGEFLQGWSVAIKGKRIAYVGKDGSHTIGPETEVLDASGKTLIPGLIDGHAHIFWYSTPCEFLKYAMRGGTTTIITEIIEVVFSLGYQGIMELLEAINDQPIKIFALVPSMLTISPASETHAMDVETLRELLQREEFVGLGETFWSTINKRNERIYGLFAETLAAGKQIEGHSAGARGSRLISYMAAGISSCHEATTAEEAIERLRLGIYTMIREGDVRRELSAISKIKDEDIDFRRLTLVTDSVNPNRLMKDGYMEVLVQKAIDFGFDPILAIQMATLNVAEHFNLDNVIGGIAPGKNADIVIIPDLRTIKAEYVISNGRVIARRGELVVAPRKAHFSKKSFPSIQIDRRLGPADFAISVEEKMNLARMRVINMVTDLVSRESQLDMSPLNGEIKTDIERDILKVAVITGGEKGMKMFVGLVKGFGMKKGAFVTSAAWDACALVIVGVNEQDMAGAANRVIALKGGTVVFAEGQVQTEIAFPICGLISEQAIETIAEKLDDIQQKMTELGCPFSDAQLTLSILTTSAIPFLRISEEGLVDTKKGKVVDLIIS